MYTHNHFSSYRAQPKRLTVGGDGKFSRMVELLGPQNLEMVELVGPKFAQKPLSQNFT